MNLSADFWTGLAVFPAIALVAAVLVAAYALTVRLRARLADWRPRFTTDPDRRARHVAGLAVADRFLVVPLGGGRVVAWRRKVNDLSDPARQAYATVYDALQAAAADPLASRDEKGSIYGGRDLADDNARW